jgi:hypothetical protein
MFCRFAAEPPFQGGSTGEAPVPTWFALAFALLGVQ